MSKEDFINFGTYSAEEVDILKSEFEKNGIPVKVLYPGTNVGREQTAGAQWSSLTILIPADKTERADKIRKTLNIFPSSKILLPKLLYAKVNRYIFGAALLIYFSAILLGFLDIWGVEIKNEVGWILVGTTFAVVFAFLGFTTYKIFKKKENK